MNNEIQIYIVGGYIRDTKMGLKPNDIDYIVETDTYETMKEYVKKEYIILLEKKEFGTIKAKHKINKTVVDFVYCSHGSLYSNLSSRDFTINAIAKNIKTKKLIDPFLGLKDIDRGILKCVLSLKRIEENPIRIFRALRFCITKNLELEETLENFILSSCIIKLILKIPENQIKNELAKCFRHDTVKTIKLLSKMHPDTFKLIFSKIYLYPKIK